MSHRREEETTLPSQASPRWRARPRSFEDECRKFRGGGGSGSRGADGASDSYQKKGGTCISWCGKPPVEEEEAEEEEESAQLVLLLDLLTVWATTSVRVEVPLSTEPRIATSPGYTPERRSLQSPLDDAASPNPIRDDARRV